MVDTSYKFSRLNSIRAEKGNEIFRYKFREPSGKLFRVEITDIGDHCYEVGFFLSRLERAKPQKKYGELQNVSNPGKVLFTTLNITIHFLKKIKPDAALLFVGFPLPEEKIHRTKRFRVYKLIASKYFPTSMFIHATDSNISFYALYPKSRIKEEKVILGKVTEFDFNGML